MRYGVRRVLTFPGTKTCFAVPESAPDGCFWHTTATSRSRNHNRAAMGGTLAALRSNLYADIRLNALPIK